MKNRTYVGTKSSSDAEFFGFKYDAESDEYYYEHDDDEAYDDEDDEFHKDFMLCVMNMRYANVPENEEEY